MADLLSIGRSGLSVSKKALETTGHNISNVNTKGYSRQRVIQQSNAPQLKEGMIQGTGARIKGSERIHNKFIERRLQRSLSENSFYNKRSHKLAQIENIFNEIDQPGLNQVINKFYNSFRQLANQPENETVRSVVRDNARLVVDDFHRIHETMDILGKGIDQNINGEITDINTLLKNIANLNKKIASLEAVGDTTGDLRDQRDTSIRELAKSFKIHTYTDSHGNFNISAVGVGTLVAGGSYQELSSAAVGIDRSDSGVDGSVEIFFKSRPSTPITSKFKIGGLASLIKVRNEDLKGLRESVDEVAFNFVNSINAIHRRGHVNRKIEIDSNRRPASFDKNGATKGVNFFGEVKTVKGAAAEIKLSREVIDDLSNIVTALAPNSPGDNRISLAISKLQHERIMNDGRATIEEAFLSTIGKIGLEAGKANLDKEQSSGILSQTQALKERYSGVSIDEETANMIKFQHAYEASAKVMQTANDMFDTVISIKK